MTILRFHRIYFIKAAVESNLTTRTATLIRSGIAIKRILRNKVHIVIAKKKQLLRVVELADKK